MESEVRMLVFDLRQALFILFAFQAATMNYVAARTSIPVPRVLHLNLNPEHPLGVYLLLEKVCMNIMHD
jgi:hypothetical protein